MHQESRDHNKHNDPGQAGHKRKSLRPSRRSSDGESKQEAHWRRIAG
jgi:hypothetical protein